MKVALIYPPLSDPTCPYLSLPYLASYIRSCRDYDVTIIDANIEALIHCSHPDTVSGMLIKAEREFSKFDRSLTMDRIDKVWCKDYFFSRGLEARAPQEAIAVMRDRKQFYDYSQYYKAALTLMRWLRLLGLQGYPGQFAEFTLAESPRYNLCSLTALTTESVLNTLSAPFSDYFCNVLNSRIISQQINVIGISVTYHEQLPFALFIAKELRRCLSDVKIVMGGTDISQIWKYTSQSKSFAHLFKYVDACIIGEGENAFLELLDSYAAGREPYEIGNVLTAKKYTEDIPIRPRYESLAELPTPSFKDLPWDMYFSPDRFVYYAPTRGCYWDRCTFCDYGLANDRPTSPWRQRPLEKVVEDLRLISTESQFVYFSVDVISPAFLFKLARRILDEGIHIRWGAELRLERHFEPEYCRLLAQSGCVGISVGFESGNQRILDLIDKGTRVDSLRQIIRNFSDAGIAVQIMGFTGFPTETYEEALDSVHLLQDLRDDWVFGGLGKFELTSGSMVAKQPELFGISRIAPRKEEDIHCFLHYEEHEPPKTDEQRKIIDEAVSNLRHPLELPRPFVGGTDTAHSYFYFLQFGKCTRQQLDLVIGTVRSHSRIQLRGEVLHTSPLNLATDEHGDEELRNGDRSTAFLLLEDGRILRCSWLVSELEPYLRGQYTLNQLEDMLPQHFGASSFLHSLELKRLIDCGLVRSLRMTEYPEGNALASPIQSAS